MLPIGSGKTLDWDGLDVFQGLESYSYKERRTSSLIAFV
jgi:hypothetical protein